MSGVASKQNCIHCALCTHICTQTQHLCRLRLTNTPTQTHTHTILTQTLRNSHRHSLSNTLTHMYPGPWTHSCIHLNTLRPVHTLRHTHSHTHTDTYSHIYTHIQTPDMCTHLHTHTQAHTQNAHTPLHILSHSHNTLSVHTHPLKWLCSKFVSAYLASLRVWVPYAPSLLLPPNPPQP